MAEEIWFGDMAQCETTAAISENGRRGTWISVDYEIEATLFFDGHGRMLFGLPGSGAPPVTLPLGLKGWHEVRLGIFYGIGAGTLEDRFLLAKLSDDAAFSRFGREYFNPGKDGEYPEKLHEWNEIEEVFWKRAELTGQAITFARPEGGQEGGKEANIAYVRTIPMGEQDLSEYRGELPRDDTRVLIANYDGGNLRNRGIISREGFLAEFQCLRDSDFAIVLHGVARGSITLYPSRVGEFARSMGFHGGGHFLRRCVENGLDPLRELIDAAHTCGVKLFPQNRLVGVHIPTRHFREDYGGRLMLRHPEWLCTYPGGHRLRHLSLAFQGVRDFHVRLMREWVEDYRADGVNVIFSRSFPFVYYEEPVCQAFVERHGVDMREVPPDDERVQLARAGFVTQFLREVRAMLDEVGEAQGRRIPNCYLVPVNNSPPDVTQKARDSGIAECMYNALDVAEWIREGLVDYLLVHMHMFREHDGSTAQPKIREFTDLARGTKTKVIVDIYPRRLPPRKYRQIAMNYYAAGADGLSFWDFQNRYPRASEVAFIKRLGHAGDLPNWEGRGNDYFRKVPLVRLDGFLTAGEFAEPHDG